VIGLPFNDRMCLGTVTELVADLVATDDVLLAEIAARHPTTESLATWIRCLPQRDDLGDKGDGPKVDACEPPQRLRIPAPDPNCLERAALYVGAAELIDPAPLRQLATLDTEIGLHTFPVENGAPVILDPRVPRNGLAMGLALERPGPVAIEPREAIEWTVQLAEAGAAPLRNGPSRVRRGRNAMRVLVDEGVAPADEADVDAIAWVLTLAERVARKYGARVVAMVRSTAQAVAELADEALARTQRNLAIEIGGTRLEAPPWLSGLARVATRVGVDVGAIALRAKLATYGIDDSMLALVEEELNKDGMTMGPLARPMKPATFATVAQKRTA
jgi:hypothetical protein